MYVWYCAAVAVKQGPLGEYGTRHPISVEVMPFAVLAANVDEAIGKATRVMERMKKRLCDYDQWAVKVNPLHDDPVQDPDKARISVPDRLVS